MWDMVTPARKMSICCDAYVSILCMVISLIINRAGPTRNHLSWDLCELTGGINRAAALACVRALLGCLVFETVLSGAEYFTALVVAGEAEFLSRCEDMISPDGGHTVYFRLTVMPWTKPDLFLYS